MKILHCGQCITPESALLKSFYQTACINWRSVCTVLYYRRLWMQNIADASRIIGPSLTCPPLLRSPCGGDQSSGAAGGWTHAPPEDRIGCSRRRQKCQSSSLAGLVSQSSELLCQKKINISVWCILSWTCVHLWTSKDNNLNCCNLFYKLVKDVIYVGLHLSVCLVSFSCLINSTWN